MMLVRRRRPKKSIPNDMHLPASQNLKPISKRDTVSSVYGRRNTRTDAYCASSNFWLGDLMASRQLLMSLKSDKSSEEGSTNQMETRTLMV